MTAMTLRVTTNSHFGLILAGVVLATPALALVHPALTLVPAAIVFGVSQLNGL
jgi:hypothetical protein